MKRDHTYAKQAKREIFTNPPGNDVHCINLVFWNVNGKDRFLKCIGASRSEENLLVKCDVSFLSETWKLKPEKSVNGKDFEASPAVPSVRRGRPSGGLEMYSPPQEEKERVSNSPYHIAIKLQKCVVIGIYYKPSLELDDRVNDLIECLERAREKFPELPIILGGDFNMHYQSEDFANLQEILDSQYDIVLASDPAIPTFLGNTGEPSTLDYIFCSRSVIIREYKVPPRVESDHQPLVIEVEISTSDGSEVSPKRQVNIQECICQLNNLSAVAEYKTFDELTEHLHHILTSCQHAAPPIERHSHKIEVLKQEAKDAFSLLQLYKNDFFRNVYRRCRTELHKELAVQKRRLAQRHAQKVIGAGKTQGIRSLYRYARTKSQNDESTISLKEWFDYCFDLYQSFDEPIFNPFPSVPTKSASALLTDITEGEIRKAIEHQKSLAKGYSGTSPVDIRKLCDAITPLLRRVFNEVLQTREKFPHKWMTTIFFFLHKKGSLQDPANYRSLAIEEPILKIFTSIICNRLERYCEDNNALPTFQCGFRKNLSTMSATSVLKMCIDEAFAKKKKVYAAFIDYKKAFDLTDRTRLCQKLQHLGVPPTFVELILSLLSGLQFRVRSAGALSPTFNSFNGVPQGDPLSPLLYSIYTHDLPDILKHEGVSLGNTEIKYLLYADDLVLISSSSTGLQNALNRLGHYTRKNNLTVNTAKTKCMIFHKGYVQKPELFFENQKLDICNNFTYLGIVFTTQLSSSKHAEHILSKCNAKVGYLFSALKIKELPLPVALDIFNTYILPIVTYGTPVWLPSITENTKNRLNALYTKFLKRYLGVPYSANNAIVHHITQTCPLTVTLEAKLLKATLKVAYPPSLGSLRVNLPEEREHLYSAIEHIPTHFWLSVPLEGELPIIPEPRRALLYTMMDLVHSHLCERNEFHLHPDSDMCKCRFCGATAEYYHSRNCERLKLLTPCALLKTIFKHRS